MLKFIWILENMVHLLVKLSLLRIENLTAMINHWTNCWFQIRIAWTFCFKHISLFTCVEYMDPDVTWYRTVQAEGSKDVTGDIKRTDPYNRFYTQIDPKNGIPRGIYPLGTKRRHVDIGQLTDVYLLYNFWNKPYFATYVSLLPLYPSFLYINKT